MINHSFRNNPYEILRGVIMLITLIFVPITCSWVVSGMLLIINYYCFNY